MRDKTTKGRRFDELDRNINKLRLLSELILETNMREVFDQHDGRCVKMGLFEILKETVRSYDEYFEVDHA